jgi:hypothetical protein
MPDRMEAKLADTGPIAYGAHELWVMQIPGAGLGVEKTPFILVAPLP